MYEKIVMRDYLQYYCLCTKLPLL